MDVRRRSNKKTLTYPPPPPLTPQDWLLSTVAREEWGFDGYITSDCDADSDVFYSHGFTDTPEQAVEAVLKAGTDVDCGGFVQEFAQGALDQGLITEADIDERLYYLWRMRMRLSHFDPIGPLDKITLDGTACTDYSINLAYDAVIQSATLLKNEKATFPLSQQDVGNVVVIGPNSELAETMETYYGPNNHCDQNGKYDLVSSVAQFATTTTIEGVHGVASDDESGIANAVAAAKEADQVILAVGTDLTWAAEGHDAVGITFPGE